MYTFSVIAAWIVFLLRSFHKFNSFPLFSSSFLFCFFFRLHFFRSVDGAIILGLRLYNAVIMRSFCCRSDDRVGYVEVEPKVIDQTQSSSSIRMMTLKIFCIIGPPVFGRQISNCVSKWNVWSSNSGRVT